MTLTDLRDMVDLCNSSAYKALVNRLAEEFMLLEDEIEKSSDSVADVSLLAKWKAYRRLIRRMRELPKEYEQTLQGNLAENPSLNVIMDMGEGDSMLVG